MGAVSTYARNAGLSHLLGVAAYSTAATHYFGALVEGVEVTGGGYARKAMDNNTTTWPNAAGRAKANGAAIVFVSASGADWGLVDEIVVYDASSGGNILASDTLDTPVQIDDGDTLTIAIGDVDITAPAGSVTDTHVHLMLNRIFGGAAWTAQATLQFAYFDGDPQGAGAEITGTSYARDVVDNDGVTWSAAASGVARNLIDFAFPTAGAGDWDTADYWALYDNAGTGLVMSAALPAARAIANGETETIQAGRVRPTWS